MGCWVSFVKTCSFSSLDLKLFFLFLFFPFYLKLLSFLHSYAKDAFSSFFFLLTCMPFSIVKFQLILYLPLSIYTDTCVYFHQSIIFTWLSFTLIVKLSWIIQIVFQLVEDDIINHILSKTIFLQVVFWHDFCIWSLLSHFLCNFCLCS